MVTAVFAGSFDPITLGHLDILKKASKIFDKIIIAVAYNPEKKAFLPVGDRISLIQKSVDNIDNIEIGFYDNLTVNYAKENDALVLIRGIRNSNDFEYENQIAQINSQLDKNIVTVFFAPNPEHSFISSSAVRELISQHSDISGFVPEAVNDYVLEKFYS